MKTRKRVTVIMTVSVPAGMTPAAARREIRSLVNDQCNYSADPGDVKAIMITPATWAHIGSRSR